MSSSSHAHAWLLPHGRGGQRAVLKRAALAAVAAAGLALMKHLAEEAASSSSCRSSGSSMLGWQLPSRRRTARRRSQAEQASPTGERPAVHAASQGEQEWDQATSPGRCCRPLAAILYYRMLLLLQILYTSGTAACAFLHFVHKSMQT